MPQIPRQVLKIAEQLKNQTKPPKRRSVPSILQWWGKARRGEKILSDIEAAFRIAGVRTEPSIMTAAPSDVIRFSLIQPPPQVDQAPPVPDSGPATLSPSPQPEASPQCDHGGNRGLAAPEPDPETNNDSLEVETDEPTTQTAEGMTVVLSDSKDWTISALMDKYQKGKLALQPKFQREYVWQSKPELPSRLIESLLLQIPIPPLYFGKAQNGNLEVIDGQQRLTTFINFVRNDFALRKLKRRLELQGKFFRDLPEADQNTITDAAIHSVVIDAGSSTNLKYEVFERLNRGSMALNEQEVRNCVYRGPFNDLLLQLETDVWWRKMKGGERPEPRFIEREMILRFLAFADRLQDYTGNLKKFLNDYMEKYAPRDADVLKEKAAMFRETMRNIYAVFGDRSGRLYVVNEKTHNGSWDTKFSIAVLDIQASALMRQQSGKVQLKAEQIRETFLYLLLTDDQVREAIAKQTTGTKPTMLRWSKFKALVQPILDETILEPRFFDYELRQRLYDKSPKCALCGNEIHSFEDTTVDHKQAYSSGGKTVPENAQLAHRSCNAAKGKGTFNAGAAAG